MTAADLPESLTFPTAVAGADFGWALLEDQGAGWVSVDGLTWIPISDGMPGARTFWVPQSLSVGHGMIAVSGTEELVFGVLED